MIQQGLETQQTDKSQHKAVCWFIEESSIQFPDEKENEPSTVLGFEGGKRFFPEKVILGVGGGD